MNIEEFREYRLSFKGVHEKMPFPNVPDKYSRDVRKHSALCVFVSLLFLPTFVSSLQS